MDHRTLELQAGAITLEFEPASAMVRDLRVGGIGALRGIYGVVRDPDRNTVPAVIEPRELRPGQDHFNVEFDAVSSRGTPHLTGLRIRILDEAARQAATAEPETYPCQRLAAVRE